MINKWSIMAAMMAPKEVRNDVLTHTMTQGMSLSQSNRAMFTTMQVQQTQKRHQAEQQKAVTEEAQAVSSEITQGIEEAVSSGISLDSQEFIAKYPRISKYDITPSLKQTVTKLQLSDVQIQKQARQGGQSLDVLQESTIDRLFSAIDWVRQSPTSLDTGEFDSRYPDLAGDHLKQRVRQAAALSPYPEASGQVSAQHVQQLVLALDKMVSAGKHELTQQDIKKLQPLSELLQHPDVKKAISQLGIKVSS